MPVFKIFNHKNSKIGIWKLTENVDEIFNLIFDALSNDEKQKYAKFKSNQRKLEWLATRLLLQKIQQSPFFSVIKYSESCKPYLETQNIGISHSRNFVAVIISDTNEVSIDVEKISGRAKKLIDKFLSIEEKSLFDISDDKTTTLLWSAKETIYKYYGKKELPFIEQIKILSIDYQSNKIISLLQDKKKLEIKFNILENNVLCYIAE